MLISNRGNSIHFRFYTDNGETVVKVIPRSWRRVYAPSLREYSFVDDTDKPRSDKYQDACTPLRGIVRDSLIGGNQLRSNGERRQATTIVVDPKPPGYYKLFCAHDKAYWSICGMCRRDRKEAAINWGKLTSKMK